MSKTPWRILVRRAVVTVTCIATATTAAPALFTGTATADTGSTKVLVFSTQPGDAGPGQHLAPQPVVTIENASDSSTATDDSSSISLSLDAVALVGGGTYVKGTLTCADQSASSGVATFTDCQVSSPGKYTLTANDSSDNVSVTSAPFVVSGPAQLVFTRQPGNGTAGNDLGHQPQVTIEDANGNPVAPGTAATTGQSGGHPGEVGLAIQGGTGTPAATLTCDSDGTAANVIAFDSTTHEADFTHCSIDKSGTGYKVYAVDPYDQLISAPSTAFQVSAGGVSQLAFLNQPSTSTGGVALASQPLVALEDSSGNIVSAATDHISLSITPNTGATGAALSCTHNGVDATAGQASFAGCAVDKAATGYTLTATDTNTSPNLQATSTAFPITTGPAALLGFAHSPSGGASGAPFGTQPDLSLTDAGGNPVSGSVRLAITANTGSANAVLNCPANPIGAANGDAQFAGCSIDRSGLNFTLTATAGSLSAVSTSFDIGGGSASAISFGHVPDATGNTGGTAFATQPTVHVSDSGGQPANSDVTLSIAQGPDGASLSCDSLTVTSLSALATFSGCAIDKAGGYRLQATLGDSADGPIIATSSAFDVGVGDAAQLAFTSEPHSGTGGVVWSTQPVVTVEDNGGNPVGDATGDVTLFRTAGTGTGTLSCQDATIPLQVGRASFAGCSIDKTSSAYTLSATWHGLTATSDAFRVDAGQAVSLDFTRQPGGAIRSLAFGTQPEVKFEDAGGNQTTVGAGTVDLTVTPGTGPGALSSCTPSPAGGSTSYSTCAIDAVGGGYALTATGGGLVGESQPFSVTPAAPQVGHVPAAGIPTPETFGGQAYGVNPTDVVDDVNTASGALTFASTDLRVAGIAKPFLLARTYNSADSAGGFFGKGWSSLLDVGVTVVPGKTATVRGEDGQQLVWTWKSKTSAWVAPLGARGTLTCGGNHCRFTRTDGSYWDVNDTAPNGGQLQTYKAADGSGLTFNWSAGKVLVTVTSTNATAYQVLGTINNGEITSVTTPDGRTVSYGYDPSTRQLTSVTDSVGRVWTFSYNAAGLLTCQRVSLPGGAAVTRLIARYDSAGRVHWVSAKGSAQHTDDTFTYGAGGVTTRNANTSVGGSLQRVGYTYTYSHNFLVQQGEPTGATTNYSYDNNGNLVTVLDPLGWSQTMTYSAANDLTKQTNALGHTVAMTYDSQHRVISRTDARGNTTKYTYSGPYLTTIAPPGSTKSAGFTTMSYNHLGELTLVKGPLGEQAFGYDAFGTQNQTQLKTLAGVATDGPGTSSTYDEAGDRLSATDADGRTTRFTYDAAGDLLSTTRADGTTTTYQYNGSGEVTQVSVGNKATSYSWNEADRTRTTTVDGHDTTASYDPSGNLLTQSSGGTTTTSNVYDAGSELVATTDASGVTTRYTYDLAGNAVHVTSSAGDEMRKQFDALDRPIRQVLDGAVTRTEYDAAGNVTSTRDAAGRITNYTYNAANQITSTATAAGTTRFTYDLDGNLTSTVAPKGNATTYSYNAANWRTATTVAGSATTFGYDNAGNVTSITDPDGRKTAYQLDADNRPVTTTYSGGPGGSYSVTQAYNAQGLRTDMTDPTGNHHFTYDDSGDLTSASYAGNTFSYDYSHAGKIIETYPDGTQVSYGIDDERNVMSVDSGTQGQPGYIHVSYLRNAQRFTTGIAYSNGVLESQQLDQAGHVLDQSLSLGGQQAADDSFSYDAAGDRLTQTDNVGGQVTTNSYGYDGTGRLTGYSSSSDPNASDAISWPAVDLSSNSVPSGSVDNIGVTPTFQPSAAVSTPHAPSPSTDYTYDENGNQTSSDHGQTSYGYSNADQLTSAGSSTEAYDHNGDLTTVNTSSGTETLTYDSSDHLTAVTLPSGRQITYAYDGDGNRVSKTVNGSTTDYLWDPANSQPQLALEQTGSGNLIRRYFYGDGPVAMQTSSNTYFYQLDPQGSVAELTNSDGSLAAAYTYDPYGRVTTIGSHTPDNPLLFQGEYLDSDTGLYDLGARNYDPATGRFTQRDPLERPAGTQSVSPYVFVNDRPTVFTDPTGLFPTAGEVFWSHDTVGANGASIANYGLTGFKAVKAVGTQVVAFADEPEAYLAAKWQALSDAGSAIKTKAGAAWDYVAEKFSSTESATEQIADNIGEAASAESEAAGPLLEDSAAGLGELGAGAGEAAEAGEALEEAGTAAKVGGILLGVAAIGLQTFITVEDCEHDSVQKCVGDAVGTVVSTAFFIGCTAFTAGAGAVVCGLAGAALSFGLQYVISNYGPQMVAGLIVGYQATAQAFTTAGDWVANQAEAAAGAIVSGLDTAASAVATGFDDAINTLVDAGYSAAALAETLANDFNEGINTAVNALIGFGYDLADIATALANGLNAGLNDAVRVLKNTFNYTVSQIADAMDSAYTFTEHELGAALQLAQYAVDQVATGLESAYHGLVAGTDAAVAAVLDGLTYTAAAITGALQSVYDDADQAVAVVLKGLTDFAVNDVAGALEDIYNEADSAVASALDFASYTITQITGALDHVFNDVAATAASIIDGLGADVNAVGDALHSVYTELTDVAATQILKNLQFAATEIAGVLSSAWSDGQQAVASALEAVSYGVNVVTNALTSTFNSLVNDANTVASLLYSAGYSLVNVGTALADEFHEIDSTVVHELTTLTTDAGYALSTGLNLAAAAIGTVFNEAQDAVARALQTAQYTLDEITSVLQAVYADAAQAVAQTLKDIGVGISQIIGVLQNTFALAENAIASTLNTIGEALEDVANALESAFNQTVNAVAGVLQAIGISTSTIDAIGGAFASFGNAIVSGVESAWHTISSWF